MPHECDACGKIYTKRKQLHRHEGKCTQLRERSNRRWNSMREAERDPEQRRKRRLAEERFLEDDLDANLSDRIKAQPKKAKTLRLGLESGALEEGPSQLGASVPEVDYSGNSLESPTELYHRYSPEPMNLDDMPQGPEPELPAKRVRRLTERAT